jgi:7-cyano-7-deazaguanine reductase
LSASLKPLREVEGQKELMMTTEVLEHTGIVIEETPDSALRLQPLETFEYKYPGKEITISFTCPEFTCICPFSDFPDFATIKIDYAPHERCIELKSLKLYISSFRAVKMFHEHVINRILEDFVRATDPLNFEIEGDFNVRGNIKTVIRASYRRAETSGEPRS